MIEALCTSKADPISFALLIQEFSLILTREVRTKKHEQRVLPSLSSSMQ